MDFMFGPFDAVIPTLCVLVFAVVLVGFLAMAVSGLRTWHKNNRSPRLSVEAEVVSKRMDISHYSHANAGDLSGAHGFTSESSTSYYVTFQTADGSRMEFFVPGEEYGLLAESDRGTLCFQGTRYLSFQRKI